MFVTQAFHQNAIVTVAVLTLALSGCNADFMQTPDKLKAVAKQSLELKNYTDFAGQAQKLIEIAPNDFEGYFLLAQAKSLLGEKNAALSALEQAIKKGLKNDQQIDKNSHLEAIKSMSAYTELMNSSFPTRASKLANSEVLLEASASSDTLTKRNASRVEAPMVSIKESNGKQTIRAGDVVIEVPNK